MSRSVKSRLTPAQQAVIAARATRSTNQGALGVPNLTAVKSEVIGWQGVRRHGNKRTVKGGSSTGGPTGCWATVAPSYRDTATHDGSWSQTVRNRNV